jgi:hypothetical protein
MKYSEADIMNADKKGIDYNCGENNLYREKADFDTVAKTDVLIEAMPKKQTKTTVDTSFLAKANDTSLYS